MTTIALGWAWWAWACAAMLTARSHPLSHRWPSRRGPAQRRLVLGAAAAVLAVVVLGALPAVLLVASAALAGWWRSRREAVRRATVVAAAVPELVDLIALALRGGSSPLSALDDIGPEVPGPLAEPVAAARRRLSDGVPPARALDPLVEAGGRRAEQLRDLLVQGWRDGVPLADPIAALAERVRDDERRLIDQRVRRLPVLLLAPLFLCLLPAFVLLVIVPIAAVGVGSVGAW